MASQTKKGEATPALTDILDTLKERRKRLDEADTTISNLIKDIETELQAHLNVRVSADITDYASGGFPTALAFGKHDGKWQLTVEAEFPDGTDDKTPLLSCSRETRVRMITDMLRSSLGRWEKGLRCGGYERSPARRSREQVHSR